MSEEMPFQKVYRDENVDLSVLEGKTIAVLGYGIQGGPQSLCMRDSGLNVIIGAGPRDQFPDWEKAEADGFDVVSIAEATLHADVVHFLCIETKFSRTFERIRPLASPTGSTFSMA